jgi:D-psicose/D-tagatose/L-ribulose 3-epimerase
MKIGISAFAWTTRFTSRHLALFPSLREHGLSSIEVGMFDPASLPAAEIRHAAEANDLQISVCAILPAEFNPISPDAEVRTSARHHLLQCIETASEMGAHLICGPVYAPIGYLPGRRRNDDEWQQAIECLQSLGEALDRYDITLAIEPVNRSETFFLNTGADARELCAAIGHPRIGATLDTFHANIEEKNIARAIETLGPKLKHMHISENDRGLVGSGHIDFAAILQSLGAIAYDGCLLIEGFGYSPHENDSLGALWGDPSVSPEDIAFRGASYLRTLGSPLALGQFADST